MRTSQICHLHPQAVRKKYTSSKFQSSAIVAEAVLAAGSSA